MKRPAFLLLTALAVGMTSGCSSNSEPPATHQASVGQQLTDLERAHREGIISEREYEKLRKAIIRKND